MMIVLIQTAADAAKATTSKLRFWYAKINATTHPIQDGRRSPPDVKMAGKVIEPNTA